MKILQVPKEFQTNRKFKYLPYSNNGYNMEEEAYKFFLKHKDEIKTDRIYIPVFWSIYYFRHRYGELIDPLLNWMDKLDRKKKYFTVVQYATGIYTRKLNLDIIIFGAGGGGLNLNNKKTCEIKSPRLGPNRVIFTGNKAQYFLPLITKPLIPYIKKQKDIFCSFVGRFDTHPLRFDMKNILSKDKRFIFYGNSGFKKYQDIMARSIFTLAPRGYGITSFRLFEAMILDSIPIYIWDDCAALPFNDEIDWNEICILVKPNQMKDIPKILDNISKEKRREMLKKIKEYNEKYFNYEKMFEYIQRKIQKIK